MVLRKRERERARRRGTLLIGDVYRISSSMTAEQVVWNRARYGGQDAQGLVRQGRG
ncbi:hypothetical protein AB0G64_05150 [Streptomyces longwoodensis]|uniref:hypothetical protein n=1 Tax=Streptomyces longwoodensis TaxID=68231 RepID=UPI0033DCE2E5